MRLGRRRFGALTLALLSLAGFRTFAASRAGDDPEPVLAAAATVLFPHKTITAARYRQAAAAFLTQGAGQGQALAAALGGAEFLALPGASRSDRMRAVQLQQTASFLAFRFHVMTHLYGDAEVTRSFGYEGASLEQGGYLRRGFDDMDWLPEPGQHAR